MELHVEVRLKRSFASLPTAFLFSPPTSTGEALPPPHCEERHLLVPGSWNGL